MGGGGGGGVSVSVLLGASVLLAIGVGYTSGTWCVCKDGLSDTVLQRTLDYACGAGADCTPIRASGVCYNPNSVKSHCSYAVNSYFQKRNQAAGTCDFGGTASVTAANPSTSPACSFPASSSGSGSTGTTTPTITVPSTSPSTPTTSPTTTTPISGTPRTSSPYTTTVPAGTGSTTTSSSYPTGIGSSVAPTGVGMNDDSQGGTTTHDITTLSWFLVASILLLWN